MKKSVQYQTYQEKISSKKNKSNGEWVMLKTFKSHLMIYAMIDFTIQLIAQLPVYQPQDGESNFGFRKIWTHDEEIGIDKSLSLEYFEDSMRHKVDHNESAGLEFNKFNFNM